MRRLTKVVIWISSAFMLCSATGALAAESADTCVGVHKSEADHGLDYELSSACEQKLACSMSWTVTCQDNHGKVTSKKNASERFNLDDSASHTVSASAADCTSGNYDIDNVRWHCDPAK